MGLQAENNPLISIVIPNYNNVEYLQECLESCLEQTYPNIELVIVDDTSTDSSVEVIKLYQRADERVRLIQNESNLGVTKTRHKGIVAANGTWVTTLDSDDYLLSKDKIDKELQIIRKSDWDPLIVAYSGIARVDASGKILGYNMKKNNTKQGDIFIELLTRRCAIPRDFIFSKELYESVGGFDLSIPIYEDWDLKIRMARSAKFIYTGIQGIAYRQLGTGLSSAKREEHLKWLNYIFEKNSEDLADREYHRKKLFQKRTLLSRVLDKLFYNKG